MIDLTSLDETYTNLKIIEIKRMLKEIKPDIDDLSPSDVINIAIIIFSYLIEGKYIDEEIDGDLRFNFHDDVMYLNVKQVTMDLKFKNALVNEILKQKPVNDLKLGETIKELVGDVYEL